MRPSPLWLFPAETSHGSQAARYFSWVQDWARALSSQPCAASSRVKAFSARVRNASLAPMSRAVVLAAVYQAAPCSPSLSS